MNWQERAEKAEAELAKLREQEPVAWQHENGNIFLPWQKDLIITGAVFSPLYAAPIPAAPAVPEEWREVMAELADDLAIEIDQDYPPERRAYPSEQRKYEGEMVIVHRARALLQSATQADKEKSHD